MMKISKNKKLLKPFFGTAAILILVTSSVTWAQSTDLIQTSRYQTVSHQLKTEQVDLLSPIIQVNFLSEVKTVGDAINHLLRYSGYSLIESKQQNQDLKNTLKKPLPLVDRDLGPVSLQQALELLIGQAFDLDVDPLNRTINFQLRAEFTHTTL